MTRGPQRAVKRADVLERITPGTIYTAGSLATKYDASKDTVYHRLRELGTIGEIETKQTGGRARIWWKPSPAELDTGFIDEKEFRSEKDPKILAQLVEYGKRGEPITSGELANILNEPQDSMYARLRTLEDRNLVKSAKVGGNSVIWWLFNADITADEDIAASTEA